MCRWDGKEGKGDGHGNLSRTAETKYAGSRKTQTSNKSNRGDKASPTPKPAKQPPQQRVKVQGEEMVGTTVL
jgi:hypothetical protein